MSNELSVLEATATEAELAILAGLDLSIGGDENLDAGDIGMPPRLRISPQNRPLELDGEKRPGVIVNTLTMDYWDNVEIVVLMYLPKTYVMWPAKFSTESDPICKSNDGNGASGGTEPKDSQSCAKCPFSNFDELGNRPACAMQRNFLVWLVKEEVAAILTLSSTALRAARTLTSLSKQQGLSKTINYSTTLIANPSGEWFIPVFKRGRKMTTPEIISLAEARDEMANLVIVADEDGVSAEPAPLRNPIPTSDTPDADMAF